jgi:transposase-like protein
MVLCHFTLVFYASLCKYGMIVTFLQYILFYWRIQRFADVVSPFVNSLEAPHLSGIYHVDEMMIHVRRENHEIGHYQWLWNLMDNITKFWISGIVSQRRELIDARKVFQDAKLKTGTPEAIIHYGLPSL